MVNPVPGYKITTPYRKQGPYWKACGWHTGVDFAAPTGTPVVAARAGTVRHTSFGSAFGPYQFEIVATDGTSDFYAHTTNRPPNGKKVLAGDRVASVGALGNVTGPHLHFERHKKAGNWSCSNMSDPAPSINAGTGGSVSKVVYLSKLKYGQKDSDSVRWLQEALNAHKLVGGANLPVVGNYGDQTDAEVIKCQKQHGFGNDTPKTSSVGPKQADHLFAGRNVKIINDLPQPPEPPTEPEKPPVDPPEGTVPRFKYSYTGKPSNNQNIGTSYTPITNGRFTAPGDGFMLSMLYANTSYDKTKTGGLRHKLVREDPVDETCYSDLAVTKDLVAPGSFLLQPVWFGAAQKGRAYHWELRRSSSLGTVTAGTRYTKWLWFSLEMLQGPSTRMLGGDNLAQIFAAFMAEGDDPRELVL